MRVVVHIGMVKTGSTSIQRTFFRRHNQTFTYLPTAKPNHSEWLARQFQPERLPGRLSAVSMEKQSLALLAADRQTAFTEVETYLAREKPKTVLISGEYLSGPTSGEVQAGLADWLHGLGANVEVIGYVRPPIALQQSHFQQRLKTNAAAARLGWPFFVNYRAMFEQVDRHFGRQKVTLKVFDRAFMHGGDVVQDIAHYLGEPLAPDEIVNANDSLPLAAVALLYVQTFFGHGAPCGYDGAVADNLAFTNALRALGSGKLQFGSRLRQRILTDNRKNIAWMEARLGHSLAELESVPDSTAIDSEDDLIDVAVSNATAFQELVFTKTGIDLGLPATPDTTQLADALNRARDLLARPRLKERRRQASLGLQPAQSRPRREGTVLFVGVAPAAITGIQPFLTTNRATLFEAGYVVPAGFSQVSSHDELHVLAMRPDRLTPLRLYHADHDCGPQEVAAISRHLAVMTNGLPSGHALLLCAPSLSWLQHDDEIAWLRRVVPQPLKIIAFASEHVRDIDSHRQDLGGWLTAIGRSDDDTALFDATYAERLATDDHARLAAFHAAFDNSELVVIDYDTAMKAEGNIIPAFLRALELGGLSDSSPALDAGTVKSG